MLVRFYLKKYKIATYKDLHEKINTLNICVNCDYNNDMCTYHYTTY